MPHQSTPPHTPTPADCHQRAEPSPRYVATPAVSQWLDRNAVPFSRALKVLEDAYEVRTLPNGYTAHTGPGYEVILGSDSTTILSVRPLVPIGTSTRTPRMRGTKTDQRQPLPQDPGEFLQLLKTYGFQARLAKGGHWRITHPQHPEAAVTMPATPSDHRWAQNMASVIRNVFGTDLHHRN